MHKVELDFLKPLQFHKVSSSWFWFRSAKDWCFLKLICSPHIFTNIFHKIFFVVFWRLFTGKSLSEALLFAENGENMLCTKFVLNFRNNFCAQYVLPSFELGIFMYWTCNSINNQPSHCGLVDAKIRASDKDLPVWNQVFLKNRLKVPLHKKSVNGKVCF